MERHKSNGSKSQRQEKPRAPQPPFEEPANVPAKEDAEEAASGDRSAQAEP